MAHIIKFKTPLAALALILVLAVSQLQADVYMFTGSLPSTANEDWTFIPGDTGVLAGDSWSVLVEFSRIAGSALPDDTGREATGLYEDAISRADLTFTRGTATVYSTSITPDQFGNIYVDDNTVFNDASGQPFPAFDGVSADTGATVGNLNELLYVGVSTEHALGSIDSIALPENDPNRDPRIEQSLDSPALVFDYRIYDPADPENSLVHLRYGSMNDGDFETVPEPSTITLWCVAALGLGGVLWRKRRAA